MQQTIFLILIIALTLPTVLAAQPAENSRYKLALGYEAAGDVQNAARVYRELYDGDPNSDIFFEAVRRTYMQLMKYNELLPVVEARLKRRETDRDLRVLYADLLYRNHRPDDADLQWQTVLERFPDDVYTYSVVGQSQMYNHLYENAVTTFLIGRKILLGNGRGSATTFGDHLGKLYGTLGQFDKASEEFLNMLAEYPNGFTAVQTGFAAFTSNPKGADAAIEAAGKRLQKTIRDVPYLELLSWLYTERGDEEGAFSVARRLDELRGNTGSNIYSFADRAMREARYAPALTAYDYFLKTFPKTNALYIGALAGYAETLERKYRGTNKKGKLGKDEAKQLLDQYLDIADRYKDASTIPDVLLRIARVQADDLNEPEDALKTLERLRSDFPRSLVLPDATLMQGELYVQTNRLDKAAQVFRECGKDVMMGRNGDIVKQQAQLHSAELLFYTGLFKEAAEAFTTLTQNPMGDVTNDALEYLFVLQENMGKNDTALRHFANGSLLLKQRQWEKAIREMDAAAGTENLADDALMGKAEALEALGNISQSVETYLGIVTKYPKGTAADRALFQAAELTAGPLNDKEKASALYLRLLTEYPTSSFVPRSRERIRALRNN